MALQFKGGKAVSMNQMQFDKLESLRKAVSRASDALAEAQVRAQAIGGMNEWTVRVTALRRSADLIDRDIYEALSNN